MKALSVFAFLAAVLLFSGCSEKISLTQPQVNNPQAPLLGVNWEPDPVILSVTSTSGSAVVLDENIGETGSGDDAPQFAWFPRRVNGKLNLVWWSKWENAPEKIELQVKASWSKGDGPIHYAEVTPVYWDGVEPAISNGPRDAEDVPPTVYSVRSMAEYLASHASSSPQGKIVLRKMFGDNVRNWTYVWQQAAEELAVHLPAAVKWTNHDTDLATYKRLWGEDYWEPYGDWEGWYKYLESEKFGLD